MIELSEIAFAEATPWAMINKKEAEAAKKTANRHA
jgi:hypothetical protein